MTGFDLAPFVRFDDEPVAPTLIIAALGRRHGQEH